MRRHRVRESMFVVGLLGLPGTSGRDANLQEAALAGLYDFVSETVSVRRTPSCPTQMHEDNTMAKWSPERIIRKILLR